MRMSNLPPDTIVLATRNRGKIDEICALLEELPVRVLSLDSFPDAPEIVEDAPTLEGNARKKALAILEHTGRASLADDTGLEVNALGGRPGVLSARYAGPEEDPAANRRKLISELGDHESRQARFRTVLACADHTGVRFFEGICRGSIGFSERGKGGFGYDALFIPDGRTRTFAELSPDTKNQISHRALALRKFVSFIRTGD